MSRLIYLQEANDYVGPFASRRDADLFLALMRVSGETLEGIEIVEIESDSVPNAVSVEERKELLSTLKRLPRLPH